MRVPAAVALVLVAAHAWGQSEPTRVAILLAEGRKQPTSADIATLRAGTRSRDPDAARTAVRALGRLGRPNLIPDIALSLRHALPEVRAEAANALAQAARGAEPVRNAGTAAKNVRSPQASLAQSALTERLDVEDEPSVRAAICESLARLPLQNGPAIERIERALVDVAERHDTITDRLGVAKAFEALVRLHGKVHPPGASAVELLTALVGVRAIQDPARDARVRRLALQSLIAAEAADDAVLDRAMDDADPQVRRLAIRASGGTTRGAARLGAGLLDASPMVRIEAILAFSSGDQRLACATWIRSSHDQTLLVELTALDQLARCGGSDDAMIFLEQLTRDGEDLADPRGWHRPAHALLSLAAASPDKARDVLAAFTKSERWQVREVAARAAVLLRSSDALATLARDSHAAVRGAAQNVRQSATSSATPSDAAPPPTPDDLRRLAAPRARFTIKDLGRFDVALFGTEAPATVARFAALVDAGRFTGLSFRGLVPNSSITMAPTDPPIVAPDEVGLWPHVRGAVGLASDGENAGAIFIDLVDNPEFDHRHTVFGQLLNGIDVVDLLLEGDVIESIEILP